MINKFNLGQEVYNIFDMSFYKIISYKYVDNTYKYECLFLYNLFNDKPLSLISFYNEEELLLFSRNDYKHATNLYNRKSFNLLKDSFLLMKRFKLLSNYAWENGLNPSCFDNKFLKQAFKYLQDLEILLDQEFFINIRNI